MVIKLAHTPLIIQQSSISDETKVFSQWEIVGIEKLGIREFKKCICGKRTRKICHIVNTQTNKKAQIGNECIGKTHPPHPIYKFLESVPKIFAGCSKILENLSNPASKELVEFAYKKSVFTEANKTFYDEHAQYTFGSLPIAKQKYRKDLNQLLIAMVSSAKLGFHRLNNNLTNIAAPRLIEYAFEKGALSNVEKQLYLNLWKKVNIPSGQYQSLNGNEKTQLINLNAKMLFSLKSDLLVLANGQKQLTTFFVKPETSSDKRALFSSPLPKSGKRKREKKIVLVGLAIF
ncbi:MAG: hypothetical protein K1060chlam3_00177 [Candidatus Anoxychlamydiales bacterium]|nr:hypothetical protein [Candidatus Anoxychlamydiales bacterium]